MLSTGKLNKNRDRRIYISRILVESYEAGLFNRILYEREYNLRAKNGEDVGVRIQTNRISDPTARQAIENIPIREVIEEEKDLAYPFRFVS